MVVLQIRYMYLWRNTLSGTLPESWGHLSKVCMRPGKHAD